MIKIAPPKKPNNKTKQANITARKKVRTRPQPAPKPKKPKKKRTREDNARAPIFYGIFRMFFWTTLGLGLTLFAGLWLYTLELTDQYNLKDKALGGALWALPSRVYARPLEFYEGRHIKLANLVTELEDLGYIEDYNLIEEGTYSVGENSISMWTNSFTFWDGNEPSRKMKISLKEDKVSSIIDLNSKSPLYLARVEPLQIASIYPKHKQDRILVNIEDVPDILIDTLLAAEDRRFYSHPGIDPVGFSRALLNYAKTGKASQGASTITQQFVKNHFLTNERKISRKVKEALISLVLEANYEKKDILEGYLNEIHLGQDGARAIHGFGLASEFYFGKPLEELGVHQIATLVGLVRNPANPYRLPKIALERRSIILDVMVKRNLISSKDSELAKTLPLDLADQTKRKEQSKYYSFLSFVYKQLKEYYDPKDLSTGMNIFTTLDPSVQDNAEKAVSSALPILEKRNGLAKNFLQTASLIVNVQNAEIIAVIGDRKPDRPGYNRALQAKRQPGSLLKPAVYLAGLEHILRYNLATMLDDSPLTYKSDGEVWKPKNYTKRYTGRIMLIDALVKSYNIPTARIGLDLGIADIVGTIERLGGPKGLPKFPSIVLGGVSMSPYEVTQMYETFANGGYRMPLRVIRDITDVYNKPLRRFPMKSVQAIDERPHFLIINAMQEIVKRGTASRLKEKISPELNIAGKTGTTDDYRDSWFAGFSGNYLNVVWVGNDDNKKTKLTGGKGAMRVWMDIMQDLPLKPVNFNLPQGVSFRTVDAKNGRLMTKQCQGKITSIKLPFIDGSEPLNYTNCYVAPPKSNTEPNLESIPEYNDYEEAFDPNSGNPWVN